MSRTSSAAGVTLAVYGLAHAAVDATCGALCARLPGLAGMSAFLPLALVLSYDLIAFGVQPVVGLVSDRVGAPRAVALAGAALVAVAAPIAPLSWGAVPAIVTAGIGNAVFHVGGGVVSIGLTPGRALAPGVFVAPGAAGLAAGLALGAAGGPAWIPAAVLVVLAAGMAALPAGAREPGSHAPDAPAIPSGAFAGIALMLLVVAVRSFVGTALVLPWKSAPVLLVALVAAIVAGKALGGALADRFGRTRIGVGALVLSLPLLLVAPVSPAAGVTAMLLFNMTMPVTLVAIVDALPGRPGFGFGLTCLALIAGAVPALAGAGRLVPGAPPLVLIAAGSAVALFVALRRLASSSGYVVAVPEGAAVEGGI